MTRLLGVLSTTTTFQVLRELFFGTARFDDFVERTEGSAPAVSRALKQLDSAGVVTRVPYREPGRRAHQEYRLTEAGEDLLPVLMSMVQWGDRHLQGGRPSLVFVDLQTGKPLTVRVTTDTGFPVMRSTDIEVRQSVVANSGRRRPR